MISEIKKQVEELGDLGDVAVEIIKADNHNPVFSFAVGNGCDPHRYAAFLSSAHKYLLELLGELENVKPKVTIVTEATDRPLIPRHMLSADED